MNLTLSQIRFLIKEELYSLIESNKNTEEMTQAIALSISTTGASSIKDMGQVMGYLKAHYAGQMDFSYASQAVKAALMAK